MASFSLLSKVFRPQLLAAPKPLFSLSPFRNFHLSPDAIIEKPLPREGLVRKDVMSIVRKEICERQSESDNRVKFFSKNDKERARPGDLMVVESITNLATGRTSSFAGVCIAIHRSGPTTSITLRNVILKVGVEQKFRVFSPLIKSITRISPSAGFRRVKLYYLRDAPRKARLGMLKKLWVKQIKE